MSRVTGNCLACHRLRGGEVAEYAAMAALGGAHHHHAARCLLCNQRWFSDLVRSPLGVPVPVRRGTSPCQCPPEYLVVAVLMVAVPADRCRCVAGMLSGDLVMRRAA